jgi:hypothetical protein
MRSGGSARAFLRVSCGVVLEPMGVARRRAGGMGRDRPGCTSLELFMTGLALGDGGMERPRRGTRPPAGARRPGTGGWRRGTVDMSRRGLEAGLVLGLHPPLVQGVFGKLCRPSWSSLQPFRIPNSTENRVWYSKETVVAPGVTPRRMPPGGTVRCRKPKNVGRLGEVGREGATAARESFGRCEAGRARAAGDVGDTSHNRQARLAGRQEHGKAVGTARRPLADLRREQELPPGQRRPVERVSERRLRGSQQRGDVRRVRAKLVAKRDSLLPYSGSTGV